MNLPTIANLSASAVEIRDFNSLPRVDYSKWSSKVKFVHWCKDPQTRHGFVSGFEGLDPSKRVSSSNPAYSMRALIIDYDSPSDDSDQTLVEKVLSRCGEFPPTHLCRTYSSGARLVWEFEEPATATHEVLKRLTRALAREVKAAKALSGREGAALSDLSKYYECGSPRIDLKTLKLSSSMINHLLLQESSKVDWGELAESVSIELVAEAVEAKFAGAWEGPFTLGARGKRFWDPTADNPTAAIVRESGMQCFTGPQPFVPWAQIFGAGFVKEATENRVARAVSGFAFDGQRYWKESPGGWVDYARIDAAMHMRVSGLKPTEVDAALAMVQTQKRVDAAVPLAYWPTGIVPLMGKRVINTFSRSVIPPHQKESDWGQGFPKLSDFFGQFFEKVGGSDTQLVHFLAWMRRFYASCLDRKPVPGQVMFIAGDVSQGKTFLSNVVMNRIFGGSVDASSYLLGETSFSGHLFESALWTIDDTKPSQDGAHSRYSAMIKKIPANQLFLYNEKYAKSKMIPWLGRVVVSCNLDAESLRILPDVETSLLDKIMLLKVATREYFDFKNLIKDLDDELPHFLRWLIDWDPLEDDPGVIEASRYEVASYHHPELLASAREVTDSHSFLELLSLFMEDFCQSSGQEKWIGTPTELLRNLMMDDSLKGLVNGMSAKAAGRRLAQLKNHGAPLKQLRKDSWRMWEIQRDLVSWQSEMPTTLKKGLDS